MNGSDDDDDDDDDVICYDAGTLSALSLTLGILAGIAGPSIVGAITTNNVSF